MKKLAVLLFVLALSSTAYSQSWRSLSKLSAKAWKYADRALTAREIYNWVTDDEDVSSYYVNPSGTWASTSGGTFYVYANQWGFAYQNAYSGAQFSARSSGNLNFYLADFYQGNIHVERAYYTVTGPNSITVNFTSGKQYYWTRIR